MYLGKYLNTINKNESNNTKATIFDKDGNKVSEIEKFNDTDKETVTKEHVTSFSKDNTNSLQDDNIDNQYGINDS